MGKSLLVKKRFKLVKGILNRLAWLCCCCCCCWVASVVSDSVRPHRRQPTALTRPWDFLGKNTGVGCHFLLQCMKAKSQREAASVVSDSERPHGLQPTGLLRPWDFPGKSTNFVGIKEWKDEKSRLRSH